MVCYRDQNSTEYGERNKNNTSIKFETKVINSSLCDYLNAYILVTGDITARNGNANTEVAFKNCAPFIKCITHINNEHDDDAENLDIIIPMHNLIEHIDNHSDKSRNLWQFKRDKSPVTDAGNPHSVSTNNLTSFKYKPSWLGNSIAVGGNRVFKNIIAIPLKYLNNFARSLEMSLINCKIHLKLCWTKTCVMSTIAGIKWQTQNYTFQLLLYQLLLVQLLLVQSENRIKKFR